MLVTCRRPAGLLGCTVTFGPMAMPTRPLQVEISESETCPVSHAEIIGTGGFIETPMDSSEKHFLPYVKHIYFSVRLYTCRKIYMYLHIYLHMSYGPIYIHQVWRFRTFSDCRCHIYPACTSPVPTSLRLVKPFTVVSAKFANSWGPKNGS